MIGFLCLGLLSGCSSQTKEKPQKPTKIELTKTPINTSGYVPFVGLSGRNTGELVHRVVENTNKALAETQSAVSKLKEEEITGIVPIKKNKKPQVIENQGVLSPGLAVPMPKPSTIHQVAQD